MTSTVERTRPFDEDELRGAVAVGNLPTLLMLLHQLTGEEAWLEEPFVPTRTRGLDLHDSGGLAEDLQVAVREAAVAALLAWSQGAEPVVPDPDIETLRRMMSVCVGEDVTPDYPPMLDGDMGFAPEPVRRPERGDAGGVSVIVIGGVSGLLASVKLSLAGIPHRPGEERQPGWHVAQQPVPRLWRRHAELPLHAVLLPRQLVDVLRATRRDLEVLPRRCRRLPGASERGVRRRGGVCRVRRRRPGLGRPGPRPRRRPPSTARPR